MLFTRPKHTCENQHTHRAVFRGFDIAPYLEASIPIVGNFNVLDDLPYSTAPVSVGLEVLAVRA